MGRKGGSVVFAQRASLRTEQRTLLGAKGIATRNKGLTTSNKKLVETIRSYRLGIDPIF